MGGSPQGWSLESWGCSLERTWLQVTIRVLGGLISAYELSHDTQLLQKADELASLITLTLTLIQA